MTYYKGHRDGNHTVAIKVATVLLVCLLAFSVTVFVGNRLKDKVDSLDSTHGQGNEVVPDGGGELPELPAVGQGEDEKEARRALFYGFDPSSFTGKTARQAVGEIKAAGFSGISLAVTDRDGRLTYRSEAASEITRGDYASAELSLEYLTELLSEARSLDMRTSAVFRSSDCFAENFGSSAALEIDRAIVGELFSVGFDEVALYNCFGGNPLSSSSAITVLSYVAELRATNENASFSLILPKEFFRDPNTAQQVELLNHHVETLSVDLRGENDPGGFCTAIGGSFTAYSLRVIIDRDFVPDDISRMSGGNVQLLK